MQLVSYQSPGRAVALSHPIVGAWLLPMRGACTLLGLPLLLFGGWAGAECFAQAPVRINNTNSNVSNNVLEDPRHLHLASISSVLGSELFLQYCRNPEPIEPDDDRALDLLRKVLLNSSEDRHVEALLKQLQKAPDSAPTRADLSHAVLRRAIARAINCARMSNNKPGESKEELTRMGTELDDLEKNWAGKPSFKEVINSKDEPGRVAIVGQRWKMQRDLARAHLAGRIPDPNNANSAETNEVRELAPITMPTKLFKVKFWATQIACWRSKTQVDCFASMIKQKKEKNPSGDNLNDLNVIEPEKDIKIPARDLIEYAGDVYKHLAALEAGADFPKPKDDYFDVDDLDFNLSGTVDEDEIKYVKDRFRTIVSRTAIQNTHDVLGEVIVAFIQNSKKSTPKIDVLVKLTNDDLEKRTKQIWPEKKADRGIYYDFTQLNIDYKQKPAKDDKAAKDDEKAKEEETAKYDEFSKEVEDKLKKALVDFEDYFPATMWDKNIK